MQRKILYVNGIERSVVAENSDLLSDVIRKSLRLTGTKVGCGKGQCGACNVIMDGKLIRSCITKMDRVPDRAAITTVEGIGTPPGSPCHPDGLDGARRCAVWFLHPRFHRLRQGASGYHPQSKP